MSRKRNWRLNAAYAVKGVSSSFDKPYEYNGTVSHSGWVTTPYGFVRAMSDAVNNLCRYDIVLDGTHYIYYEDGTRKPRGIARRANDCARDASQRARMAKRKAS